MDPRKDRTSAEEGAASTVAVPAMAETLRSLKNRGYRLGVATSDSAEGAAAGGIHVPSTIIACCGLLADSAAVVIGAMLVAPMMRPVMMSSAAITLGWSNYLYQALLLTLVMAISTVAIAGLFALVSVLNSGALSALKL